ncbi:MAG: penicillin-binding transpeptidase domain-containing protein [Longimicrobiales bacterium]
MTRRRGAKDPRTRVQGRRKVLLGVWLAAAVALTARAIEVQVLEGADWKREALRQHQRLRDVPAPRGRILDRDGGELAVSHRRVSVAIATNEVRSPERVQELLETDLKLGRRKARQIMSGNRSWVPIAGTFSSTQVAELGGFRGVHVTRELSRLYPHGELARGLLGRVRDGVGRGGLEQSMDSVLAGRAGQSIVARDNRSREIPGQEVRVQAPVPGRDVLLTIDMDLQSIAEQILVAAVDSAGARGGDLVITDPQSGEILAMVSVVEGSTAALSAVNTTYEPGSTIKPFTVAALLRHNLASLSDTVDTENGRWRINGRWINDVHGGGWMSLAKVVMESSNVGMAKLAQRLTPAQQYENLRDFGFGAPTGLPLPAEASGLLRRPEAWSSQSPQSLSIGYEIAVTPIQMAMAFGALANGGNLMEPILIREVRDLEGQAVHLGRARTIRRAVTKEVADAITPVLIDVVEAGTGTLARMASFLVAGKSGTARATGVGGSYESGAYYSSFGAYFPADDPQLLFFVKLDRPQGAYYGGNTAAPITRAMLEALLSASQSPIDRQALARARRRPVPAPPTTVAVRFASLPDDGTDDLDVAQDPGLLVPRLVGTPMRVAVRTLHELGFHVRLEGGGAVRAIRPPEGTPLSRGDTVVVVGRGLGG